MSKNGPAVRGIGEGYQLSVGTAEKSGAMWLVMRHYPPIISIQLVCLKFVMQAQAALCSYGHFW